MSICLWRGFHSADLREEIRSTWLQVDAPFGKPEKLLILCPPYFVSFDFVKYLPEGEITLGGDWPDNALKIASDQASNQRPIYPERPMLGVFTSGTVSGQPRLVLYTRQNVSASLDAIFELFDPNRIKSIFCYAQPFHTFGLLLGYILSLKHSLKLVTPDGKYSTAAHEKRLSLENSELLTLGTPAHFFDLIEIMQKRGREIAPSYSCIIGGASVSVELWKKVQSVLKIDAPSIGYGCSEASPGITHLPPGHEPLEDAEIGFPLRNLNCRFESESVHLAGESLCLAVIDENGLSFASSREIHDTLKRREDGVYLFGGRSDLVMNRGGEKFSLELLEKTAMAHAGAEILALPIRNLRLGEDLAVLVRRSGDQPDMKSEKADADVAENLSKVFLANHQLKLNLNLVTFISDFPRNASYKSCRHQARQIIEAKMNYPVATAKLADWLPHRAPMLWVDEVCSASEIGGEARVRIRKDALYMNAGELRASTVIEFIAQTFGFVSACQRIDHPHLVHSKIEKAFLVGVRSADVSKVADRKIWSENDSLLVRVRNFKTIGSMQILDGEVIFEATGEVLASANLKLYSA